MVKLNDCFKGAYVIPMLVMAIFLIAMSRTYLNQVHYIIAISALIFAIFSSVHHAKVIALRLGEVYGALILALSVTIIEVVLILMVMSSGGVAQATLARDTIFATLMIVINGVVGLSLILGGIKYKEQGLQPQGTSSLLAVLVALSACTLVLPSFTTSTTGPTYNTIQLLFAASASVILYVVFVITQTITHKQYFQPTEKEEFNSLHVERLIPTKTAAWVSLIFLIISLSVVIGFAKMLAPAIEKGILLLGAPKQVAGIVIAAIILLPEGLTAIKAARLNRLQTTLNLALGSGAASIALTIPIISIYSIYTDYPLALGLNSKDVVFLVISFLIGNMTLGTGKTTILQGAVHTVVMAAYIVISFFP